MFQEPGGGDLTGLLRLVCTLRLISCLFLKFPFTVWIMAHCGNLIFERSYVRECDTMFRTPKSIAEEFLVGQEHSSKTLDLPNAHFPK